MNAWRRWCDRTGHDPSYHGWLLVIYAAMIFSVLIALSSCTHTCKGGDFWAQAQCN